MNGQHVAEKRGKGDSQRDNLKQHAVDKKPEVLDVPPDAVDQRTAGVGVKEPEFEALQFVITLGAQIDDEPALKEVPKPDAVEVAQQETHERQDKDACGKGRDALHGGPVDRWRE